ncbi:hypothetical protein GlitD10_2771 [Gloeomargarita lithophora Alchichica-D10]|uniref:DUF488 domain-containing protein n=1 Tax=Gloeomargarita lithophora Alchichica-D10 TaxID=1188229 RepID=A0A1J0AGN8_9CYAN|nr:hypothetical protein GlitD10_2771 [Gloeomargarita lithophora Alchichica-D10]
MQPLSSIGHSQHSLESFIILLQQHNVTALADVRSIPYNRRLPQFNFETFAFTLNSSPRRVQGS